MSGQWRVHELPMGNGPPSITVRTPLGGLIARIGRAVGPPLRPDLAATVLAYRRRRAHLIAAAPEMYQALDEWLAQRDSAADWAAGVPADWACVALAREALAKARGEQVSP